MLAWGTHIVLGSRTENITNPKLNPTLEARANPDFKPNPKTNPNHIPESNPHWELCFQSGLHVQLVVAPII